MTFNIEIVEISEQDGKQETDKGIDSDISYDDNEENSNMEKENDSTTSKNELNISVNTDSDSNSSKSDASISSDINTDNDCNGDIKNVIEQQAKNSNMLDAIEDEDEIPIVEDTSVESDNIDNSSEKINNFNVEYIIGSIIMLVLLVFLILFKKRKVSLK